MSQYFHKMTDAVPSFPLQDLPIRIKWPNDIYYKDQVKLGGILVTSYALPDTCHHTTVIGKS